MNLLPSEARKWTFLRDAPQRDAQHPEIRRRAQALVDAAGGRGRVFLELAHALARDGIRFSTDTARAGGEDIAGLTREPTPDDAVEALTRGVDDCDAKARVFCALCLAAGVRAEMVPHPKPTAHGGDRLAHVSARAWFRGRWVPVELTLARARLGETGEQVPRERDGTVRTS